MIQHTYSYSLYSLSLLKKTNKQIFDSYTCSWAAAVMTAENAI